MKPIRVLIVDDSELIRQLLSTILSGDDHIEVIGVAEDPYEARDKIKKLSPDVITLDIEMPKMDGITFLKNIMRLRPLPVVMVSTLTEKGAEITMEALELGAIDFVAKPKVDLLSELPRMAGEICAKIKQAARAKVSNLQVEERIRVAGSQPARAQFKRNALDLIVIGASTGGTLALKDVLSDLPSLMPPIAVVQHMPEKFTTSFADRLNRTSALNVIECDESGMTLKAGSVYIAKGGEHMKLVQRNGGLISLLESSPPVNRHRPSVDVLFDSVAAMENLKVLAVLLTGMGADGANGMGNLKDHGATTVAQDEASSIVWGMPRVAVETGVVDKVLPLNKIAEYLVHYCYKH
ncbi:chemotaxis response regulator protein-glutamate methylesterase [Halioxenophilus sp. WMMB6]|uniref:protein-glutamate methylesterase/protein-glutamine glutaminase n=1 Tax=Halioxenophilus sp. WMMB6 TaxID=3073815 RepID=UPI00295F1340|nr:chemotaxis response regulator protein-glutamate methylesterase [Halioxenophilus sp. WMMB6]